MQGQHSNGAVGVLAADRDHVGRGHPGRPSPDAVRGGCGLVQRGHHQRPGEGAQRFGKAVPGFFHAGARAVARCSGASEEATSGGSPV